MKRNSSESAIEIWSDNYINNINKRAEIDKNVDILQIERGSTDGMYIVEFLRKDWEVQ